MPAVSVILTSCEQPAYLDEAIRAIRSQTFSDFELLVCDDASGPHVQQVIARHATEDTRLRLLRAPHRGGVFANLMQGLQAATAPLLSYCNDDDAWEPTFLAAATSALRDHPTAVLAFSDHYIMDEAGLVDLDASDENTRRWGRDRLPGGLHEPFIDLAVVAQAVPMAMCTVFRRDVINNAAMASQSGGHCDLWLAYLASRTGGAAVYLPQRLMRYRVRRDGMTASRDPRSAEASIFIWRQLLTDERLAFFRSSLRVKLYDAHLGHGLALLDDAPAARRAFFAALRTRLDWRALAGVILTAAPQRIRARWR